MAINKITNNDEIVADDDNESQLDEGDPAVNKKKWKFDKISHSLGGNKKIKSKSSADPFTELAKFIPCGINLWSPIDHILRVGVAAHGLVGLVESNSDDEDEAEPESEDPESDIDSDDEENSSLSASQKRALIVSYNAMLKHTPELGPYLQHLQDTEDTESFHDLIAHVCIHHFTMTSSSFYLPADPSTDVVHPPLVAGRSKANRGVNHSHIAALFCPQKYMAHMLTCNKEDYDLVIREIQDGDIALNSKQLPAFLYDWDVFDPEDPEIGLFHGHISV
ncbi:hypothetical protein C8J56DRAFT_1042663 [Mycena floridula]|nr:hypothetical protein C8J56DRAFT_1042663 [Mycena floridula]